jgi:4-hydroxybenzoate polyprenyltransferase
MDIRDIHGDKANGIQTLPMVLGEDTSAKVAFTCQILGATSLLPLIYLLMPPYVFILWFYLIGSICLLFALWWQGHGLLRRWIIICLWLPMSLGLSILLI